MGFDAIRFDARRPLSTRPARSNAHPTRIRRASHHDDDDGTGRDGTGRGVVVVVAVCVIIVS